VSTQSSETAIDSLIISLTNPATVQNPMGLDSPEGLRCSQSETRS
jgi:hypothetical protein